VSPKFLKEPASGKYIIKKYFVYILESVGFCYVNLVASLTTEVRETFPPLNVSNVYIVQMNTTLVIFAFLYFTMNVRRI